MLVMTTNWKVSIFFSPFLKEIPTQSDLFASSSPIVSFFWGGGGAFAEDIFNHIVLETYITGVTINITLQVSQHK